LLDGFSAITESSDPTYTAALYEVEILRFAGYLPHLERCNACQSTQNAGSWFFSPRSGGTICARCVGREPLYCPALSPACLAFFRQALRMNPALLPRLKATAPIRRELREVMELYVNCVAGRRLPSTDALFAAERAPAYRQAPASLASVNLDRV
jgi:DNA repair protein RecO (recombination protein O)